MGKAGPAARTATTAAIAATAARPMQMTRASFAPRSFERALSRARPKRANSPGKRAPSRREPRTS